MRAFGQLYQYLVSTIRLMESMKAVTTADCWFVGVLYFDLFRCSMQMGTLPRLLCPEVRLRIGVVTGVLSAPPAAGGLGVPHTIHDGVLGSLCSVHALQAQKAIPARF